MDYFFNLNNTPTNEFIWYERIENALSSNSIKSIERYVNKKDMFDAGVNEDYGTCDESVRKTKGCYLADEETVSIPDSLVPVYKELSSIIKDVNSKSWMYNIGGWEAMQYFKYGVGDHFTWHIDTVPTPFTITQRKISFSLGISHSHEYEGGDLELSTGGINPNKIKLRKNEMIIFNSFLLHRVTPITKGTRKTLVGFVHGPNFV